MANLVRDVLTTAMEGVTDLIARAPEAKSAHDLTPHKLAELIFAVGRGMLMRDVLQPPELTSDRETRTAVGGYPRPLAIVVPTRRDGSLCMTLRNLSALYFR